MGSDYTVLYIVLTGLLLLLVYQYFSHRVEITGSNVPYWLPAPLPNQVGSPLRFSLQPSGTWYSYGNQEYPISYNIELDVTTVDGSVMTLTANPDTGSNELVFLTTDCDRCECHTKDCQRWPADAVGQMGPNVRRGYQVVYGQGTYNVKYWSARVEGLNMIIAGVVGIKSGQKEVDSTCGLHPSRRAVSSSFIDTAFASLHSGLPRCIVFDSVAKELVIGERRTGVKLPLISHDTWYIVPIQKLSINGHEIHGVHKAILDTGTTFTGGSTHFYSQVDKLLSNTDHNDNFLHIQLADSVTLKTHVHKGGQRVKNMLHIPVLGSDELLVGLNALMGRVVSFDWDSQCVIFQ